MIAKCPRCGNEYSDEIEVQKQDVTVIQNDGMCTWCYAFEVEKMDPLALVTQKTLQVMGF